MRVRNTVDCQSEARADLRGLKVNL